MKRGYPKQKYTDKHKKENFYFSKYVYTVCSHTCKKKNQVARKLLQCKPPQKAKNIYINMKVRVRVSE